MLGCQADGQRGEVSLIRWRAVKARMRAPGIVQRGLRTPTEPSFENFCINGTPGLGLVSAFTKRSTRRAALFFAAA